MAHLYIKSGAFIKMLFFDRFRDVESEFLFIFGFEYLVLRNRSGLPPNLDTWIIALDISLAHLVVTLFIFYEAYYLLSKVFFSEPVACLILLPMFIGIFLVLGSIPLLIFLIFLLLYVLSLKVLNTIFKFNLHLKEDLKRFIDPWITVNFTLENFDPLTKILTIICSIVVTYGLLVYDKHLQTVLFGNYDRTLGLIYPTNYRLTILLERIKMIVENPTLETIKSFVGTVIAILVIILGIFEAGTIINDAFRKK